MAGILALDIATSCGWAHLASADAQPTYGTINAGEEPGGPALDIHQRRRKFGLAMNKLVIETAPLIVYMEDTYIGADRNATPKVLIGLHGIASFFCQWNDKVRIFDQVKPNTIKKHFSGYGWAKKEQMIDSARACGWNPKNSDEADALGLLCYAVSKHLKVDLVFNAGIAQRKVIDHRPTIDDHKRAAEMMFRK